MGDDEYSDSNKVVYYRHDTKVWRIHCHTPGETVGERRGRLRLATDSHASRHSLTKMARFMWAITYLVIRTVQSTKDVSKYIELDDAVSALQFIIEASESVCIPELGIKSSGA